MAYNKILIVDDSATSRMIIRRCFQIAGYREIKFSEAEDGLKALSILEDSEFDLIVSDLKMPKMDGQTFIKKLRMMPKTINTPVIVISSIGNEGTEESLREYKVSSIIQKPLSPAKVINFMED